MQYNFLEWEHFSMAQGLCNQKEIFYNILWEESRSQIYQALIGFLPIFLASLAYNVFNTV